MQMTALVIDDDLFVRQVLTDLLNGAGFGVVEARDGEEGCRLALERLPDVILLDLVMPVMNGLDACRHLRTVSQFKHTPIIMLTARADMEGTVNPFQVGADDYLSKPFDGEELIARIHGNLIKKRALEALDHKKRDYEVLLEITESISSSLDTTEILRQIVNRIAQLLDDVVRCSIALVQQDERYGYVLASSDDPDLSGLRLDLSKYPEILKVMQTGTAIRIDDVTRDPLFDDVRSHLNGQNFNAILVLPVIFKKSVIGAMVVRATRSRKGISQEEMEFCQLVANISANALKNARNFETVRQESELLKSAKGCLEDELKVKAVYEQVFENASEGLAAFNERGEVVFANPKALDLVGYPKQELYGVSFASILDIRSVRRVLRRRRGGESVPFDVNVRTHEGQSRLLSVSLNDSPICEGLYVAAFHDETERRSMERELTETKAVLEKANDRLRQMDRIRAEFLNTATHELRIPVTIVNGYCTLLRDMGIENLTGQQKEFLHEAIQSSERLVDLINNMLDLSRLEAGKMIMHIEVRDISAVLDEVSRGLRHMAADSGLEISVDARSSCLAVFDDEKIHQVLVNLVGNAIKFTPSGGRIRIALQERDENILVSVEDTGKGIPENRISELFEEFAQLGREDSRKGTGLGLAICKKIVESHQGSIWAESAPGKGSRFSFTLPKPS